MFLSNNGHSELPAASWLLLAVAILAVVTTAITSSFINRQSESSWWVEHTLQVLHESEHALACLIDCETGYRGYLVTRDKTYLEPYETCYRHVGAHLSEIQKLTTDNPAQQRLIAQLEELAKKKIAFSQKMIAAADASDSKVLRRDLVDLKPGKIMMDSFRSTIARVQDNEKALLIKRQKDNDRVRSYVNAAAWVLIILLLILVALTIVAIRNYAKEQKIAREALSSARDEAVAADEAKTRFLSTVSHEVRTPMAGVIGVVELIYVSAKEDDLRNLSKVALESAKRLLHILNDLLDASKLQSGAVNLEYRFFSVRPIVGDVVQLASPEAGKKQLKVSCTVDSDVPELVCGDELRLRQILQNIVFNAVKFTPKGTIDIRVQLVERIQNGTTLKFTVADSGIGLTEEQKNKLFQPFVQADDATSRIYGGTGLGLHICRTLTELMGGDIEVTSQVGRGSTFSVRIPFRDDLCRAD